MRHKSGVAQTGTISRHALEALKPDGKPIAVGPIFSTARQMQRAAIKPLQDFEHRTIRLEQQAVGYMQPIIGVYSDQMCIKGRVMNLGQRTVAERQS